MEVSNHLNRKITEISKKLLTFIKMALSTSDRINHLKSIQLANLKNNFFPLDFLNTLEKLKVKKTFPNICTYCFSVILHIFIDRNKSKKLPPVNQG